MFKTWLSPPGPVTRSLPEPPITFAGTPATTMSSEPSSPETVAESGVNLPKSVPLMVTATSPGVPVGATTIESAPEEPVTSRVVPCRTAPTALKARSLSGSTLGRNRGALRSGDPDHTFEEENMGLVVLEEIKGLHPSTEITASADLLSGLVPRLGTPVDLAHIVRCPFRVDR